MFKWLWLICIISSSTFGFLFEWEKRSVNLTYCGIHKILFVNNDTGFVFGDSGFIATTVDAGNTWLKMSIDTNVAIYDACFIPPDKIIATGSNGAFITSDNLGEKWNKSLVNMKCDNLKIFSFDGINIWIGAEYGTIFNSTDSGKTWEEINLPNNGAIYSMFFLNRDTGWVGGSSGSFYRTTNGGQEWIEAEQMLDDVYNDIYFKNAQTGWVIGDRIQCSNDGGKTWVVQLDRIYQVMRGMCFVDSLNGYIAADYSNLIFTSNGGLSWDTTSMNIQYVYPFDVVNNGNDLWIVGRGGMLCKSLISSASNVFKPHFKSSGFPKNKMVINLSGQRINGKPSTNQLLIMNNRSKCEKNLFKINNKYQ